MFKDIFSFLNMLTLFSYPFPGLVFEKRSDDRVEGVDVPGLVHKVDSSEPRRKTVLLETEK